MAPLPPDYQWRPTGPAQDGRQPGAFYVPQGAPQLDPLGYPVPQEAAPAPTDTVAPPTRPVEDCPHGRTTTRVEVGRMAAAAHGTPPYYVAQVRINCLDCGVPFQFIHPMHGNLPDQAALSTDGLELRAPMMPHAS